jgi:hypothetical protein
MSDWSKEFDDKFHKRVWNIVKQASPSSYAHAEAMGMLEGEGPQIYGEIKEYISQLLKREREELVAKIEELKEHWFDESQDCLLFKDEVMEILTQSEEKE